MSNLLNSKAGRLLAFFLLYLTEGIPYGFTSGAIVNRMKRNGMTTGQIALFAGTLTLPWAFKWVMGPIVDVFYSDKWGRRRLWIMVCQLGMMLTLLAAMPVDFTSHLGWFIAVILVHNVFAATQDVAIDSLAVTVLKENERGLANGLMFAGANTGNAIGYSGVLFLSIYIPFNITFLFVIGALALVFAFVTCRLRESPGEIEPFDATIPALTRALAKIKHYVSSARKAIFGSKSALAGFGFAILPCGAYAISMATFNALGIELGMNDRQVATLGLYTTIIAASGCVVGGLLSDRFGRRKSIAVYVLLTTIPVILMAFTLLKHGWIMPTLPGATTRPAPHAAIIPILWITSISFSFLNGLVYGSRTALFMDVCSPAVAATQFTAYMAMLNLVNTYSNWWQGLAVEKIGYPSTFFIDAGAGLLCLLFLPFMKPLQRPIIVDDGQRGFEVIQKNT